MVDIENKTQKKQLLYEGDKIESGINFDYSILTEGNNSTYHTIPNYQYGVGLSYQNIIIGINLKKFFPYKRLGRLVDFNENMDTFTLFLNYGF